MSRKILCEACGSILNEDILKQKNSENTCLVCGASLSGGDTHVGSDKLQTEPEEELITWYFYGFKNSDSYSLRDKPIDLEKFGNTYYLKYTFQAPPEDKDGNCDKAKEVLRQKYPDAFAEPSPDDDYKYKLPQELIAEGRCPRCGSHNIQIVPRRWSLLTGFLTNKVDRVCVNCKHRF
ncbi:MAG: hypothetical protein E6124_00945 [Blautia producta]|nr:hypothetical protein [Blautia producta]MDU5380753.1 hypothetical protein [Blautia producta]MDU6882077.1 hypothetical protein [Blautia producta]